jgi:hypothetical protein
VTEVEIWSPCRSPPGGQTAAKIYTYAAPQVSRLSPAHGSKMGGTVVTISGSRHEQQVAAGRRHVREAARRPSWHRGSPGATGVAFRRGSGDRLCRQRRLDHHRHQPGQHLSRRGGCPGDSPAGQSAIGASDVFTYGIIDFTIQAGTGSRS